MVSDEQYQHLIHWSGCGTSFLVSNLSEFSKEVLPAYFRHNNFTSFVRQLNMYGFQKLTRSSHGNDTDAGTDISEFFHPFFLFDRPDLLEQIKRKQGQEILSPEGGNLAIAVSMLQQQNAQLQGRVQMLETKLEFVLQDLYRQRGICQRLQILVGVDVNGL
ncbi:HSF-type DNA-binding-domain-containing protein [Paraphysoderma sedebokerense]|nr:HSF-type DNA-binding-domain-containing protein [Paraphysoderma sedebokerense]